MPQITVEISRSDLQSLLLIQAKSTAAEHGVTVNSLDLDLKQEGPRSISANVRVSAKKSFFNGIVHVTGRLDVSDDLNARLSGLDIRGEGVAGTMAAGFLKSKIKQMEGRQFPLAERALGAIHLRDVQIASIDPLRITAAFGA